MRRVSRKTRCLTPIDRWCAKGDGPVCTRSGIIGRRSIGGKVMPTHAVIWIDHKEARIFHVHPDATDATTVLAPQHHLHRHPKGRGEAKEHPDDAHRFFGEVTRTLEGIDALLIVGLSSPNLEFFRYLT